jgi:nucleotide-binding universal stress UspA family protein
MTTDGSEHAALAIATASRLLRKTDLAVKVLHVVPEAALAADAPEPFETHAKRSQSLTVKAEEQLRKQGIHAAPLIDFGEAADRIIAAASDFDVVVVGAHGKNERKQPGLGPISSEVVQKARSSVLVGRDLSSDAIYRVLVALDGSGASLDALNALSAYLDVHALDITLMHVVEAPWTTLDRESGEEDESLDDRRGYHQQLLAELRREADEIIDRGLRLLSRWEAPVTTIVEEGIPMLELTSHIEEGNYDLVVVGATGNSDMKHVVLGSVSHRIAWNAPCSVLVVRT